MFQIFAPDVLSPLHLCRWCTAARAARVTLTCAHPACLIATNKAITCLQGNCTEPPPATRRRPPLSGYQPGQCLLEADITLFTFIANPSPADVWFDGLFLRAFSRTQEVATLLAFTPRWPGQSRLWVTRVSTQASTGGGWGRDMHDPEAGSRLCVPWVTDPEAMLASDGTRVRDCVCHLVAAYLLAVGAAVSGVPMPTAHFQALHLARTTRLARLCDGDGAAGSAPDSDDEAWLRDDLPSARWLPAASALPASLPPPVPHPPPISALSGVHEAEALHKYG